MLSGTRCGSGCSMVTEMGEEGAVPTVSISEQGDGVAWARKSAVLASLCWRKSPFITPGLPELALDKIVSIPKLDPLDPSIAAIQSGAVIPVLQPGLPARPKSSPGQRGSINKSATRVSVPLQQKRKGEGAGAGTCGGGRSSHRGRKETTPLPRKKARQRGESTGEPGRGDRAAARGADHTCCGGAAHWELLGGRAASGHCIAPGGSRGTGQGLPLLRAPPPASRLRQGLIELSWKVERGAGGGGGGGRRRREAGRTPATAARFPAQPGSSQAQRLPPVTSRPLPARAPLALL